MAASAPPAALVLAAGEGRRMGVPKALLEVHGRPLVLQHVECLRAAGCGPVGVVTRPAVAPAVEELLRASAWGACVHVVPAETEAQSASLAAGVRALLAGASAEALRGLRLVVTPVDLVPPRPETVRALLARLDGEVLAVTPTFQGRGGHPVVLRGELLTALLERPVEGPPSLRELLASVGARRVRLEVEDAAVLGDLDTPLDVKALGKRVPRVVG